MNYKKIGISLGVFATVGVIGLGVMYRKEIFGALKGKKIVSKSAVDRAKKELKKWENGSVKEGSSETLKELDEYWKSVGKSYSSMKNEAWSAAFISWLMQESGAKDSFKKSASHSVYIRDAVKNRKENKGSWKGYKPEEIKINKGDLVCYARQNGVTYDTTSSYASHCDIVSAVDRKKKQVRAIGGNVSDSVKESTYRLNEKGYLDKGKIFVVLRNK